MTTATVREEVRALHVAAAYAATQAVMGFGYGLRTTEKRWVFVAGEPPEWELEHLVAPGDDRTARELGSSVLQEVVQFRRGVDMAIATSGSRGLKIAMLGSADSGRWQPAQAAYESVLECMADIEIGLRADADEVLGVFVDDIETRVSIMAFAFALLTGSLKSKEQRDHLLEAWWVAPHDKRWEGEGLEVRLNWDGWNAKCCSCDAELSIGILQPTSCEGPRRGCVTGHSAHCTSQLRRELVRGTDSPARVATGLERSEP